MLLQFAITDTCVSPTGDTAASRARVTEFRNLWRRAGVLVRPAGETQLAGLVAEARRQNPSLRDLWLNALAENIRHVVQPPGWIAPPVNSRVTEASLSPAELLLIHSTEAVAWGWGPETATEALSRTGEVARFDCLAVSRLSHAADEVTSMSFDVGVSTSRVRDHFRSCMRWPGAIAVVDPYIGKEEVDRPASSGFGQFITWLAQERAACGRQLQEVQVFTAFGMPRAAGRPEIISVGEVLLALQSLRARIAKSEIREIVVHCIDMADFRTQGHDRYVRFEELVIKLPNGMRLCRGTRVDQKTSTHWVETSYADGVEQALARSLSHRRFVC